jgi:membrane-bound lytic murein transglycosylase B
VAGAVALAAVLAGTGLGPTAAGAQERLVVEDARLHPSLAGVAVTGGARDGYVDAHRAALARHTAARDRVAAAIAATADSATSEAELHERLRLDRADLARATSEAEHLRTTLRGLAVKSYMQGSAAPAGVLDREAVDAEQRQRAIVARVRTGQQAELRATLVAVDATTRRIEEGNAQLGQVRERLAALADERATAEQDLAGAEAEVARTRAVLADWRLGADVAGSDLPLIALDAYVKAAERMAGERPECGLRWWGLAAIGRVETRHGTYGGTRPGPDGVPVRPIIGIPLDGTNGTALVGDTDGGLSDGDAVVDRAVGPMQFIPGTWRTMARDGDDDGRADVHDLHDSALAAAGLLCRSGGQGLDQAEGLRRAALGYNHSASYADIVVRHAFEYASREAELIPPPPPLVPSPSAPSVPTDPTVPTEQTVLGEPSAATGPDAGPAL